MNNKNIKLFFIDLDGTTLDIKNNGHPNISAQNIEQIKKTLKTKKIVISTGRIGSSVNYFMNKIGIDYAVAGNGSQIFDKVGKILFEDKLSKKQVLSLVNIAQKHKLALKVEDENNVYGAISKLSIFIAKIFKFMPINSYNLVIQKYHKVVFLGKFKCQMKKVVNDIKNSIANLSVVTSMNGWVIEVTNIKSTKGIANEFIARNIYNITNKNQTAHIGDTMNDSTTIGHVGRFIVMKNASKEVKKLTKYHGPSYKKAGLAKVLQGQYKKINI